MLRSLHVKNLALIRETEVEFGEGLNILTGETGAGKSIVIDAISAILETGIFGEVVKIKYDVPNSKLEMLDDYYTKIDQALAAVI